MTARQREILFYANHAGYCLPPGRMVSAQHLADARAKAELFEYTWEWIDDPEPYECWCGEPDCNIPQEVYGCVMRDSCGVVKTSLWGVADPDSAYQRVIEAELALEVFTPSQGSATS